MLSLLSVITYLDRVCIAVAGPRMQDSLHISPQAWGWVTSVFFLSYSAFEIPSGLTPRQRYRRSYRIHRGTLWQLQRPSNSNDIVANCRNGVVA